MKKFEMLKNKIKSVRENTGEEGFSLIELVVAVGILAILSVVGVIAYSGITDNARQQAVNAAAAEVYTAAVAYESGDGGKTTAEVITDYNATSGSNIVVSDTSEDGELEITATGTWGSTVKTATKPGA